MTKYKIGLGGGCHWCTEGIFQSSHGVQEVEQGWIASEGKHSALSEAVIVHYDPEVMDLKTLIKIHFLTHASTSDHSMRGKYRSAIYTFTPEQALESKEILTELQLDSSEKIITNVLAFHSFKCNKEDQLNYFYNRPDSPFCTSYIHPKLALLMQKHRKHLNIDKLIEAGIDFG